MSCSRDAELDRRFALFVLLRERVGIEIRLDVNIR